VLKILYELEIDEPTREALARGSLPVATEWTHDEPLIPALRASALQLVVQTRRLPEAALVLKMRTKSRKVLQARLCFPIPLDHDITDLPHA
jgi:hypothetical protein